MTPTFVIAASRLLLTAIGEIALATLLFNMFDLGWSASLDEPITNLLFD